MRAPKTALFRLWLLTALVATSCVREDTDKCVQYALDIRAVDVEGNDLTGSGVLSKTDIYLFNEDGFVRMVPEGFSSDYLFGEDKSRKLTLIAWGNLKEDTLSTTPITPGTSIGQARLQLRQQTPKGHLPVTDLFYCYKELNAVTVTRSVQEENIVLVMERAVAGMSIRTRYLSERYPYTGEPFYFIVRSTGTEVDFTGGITGETASYRPVSVTNKSGDVYAPPFHLLPTGEGQHIEIDIYQNEQKLCTIDEDNEFNPIQAPAGKQTNVEIDCRYVKMKVVTNIVPWGEISQDTEM